LETPVRIVVRLWNASQNPIDGRTVYLEVTEPAPIALASSPIPEWAIGSTRGIEHALAPARDAIRPVLSSWWTLAVWASLNVLSLGGPLVGPP
jgi:hypothetical protein